MKSNFQEYKLSTRCQIKSSKRVFAKEYITKGIPFVRSKDVIDKSLGTFKNYDLFISHERFRELKELTGSPKKGDILLSSVGNRSGKCYVVNDEGDFYFKDGNIIWISKFDEIDSHYLSYFFNSDLGQRILQSVMIGSAQKALTIDSIRNLRITLPNIQIQQGIANILRTLDKKIELNKKINENLEEIAKTLFKSWFIDFDPVRAKAEGRSTGLSDEISDLFPNSFEDSRLGKIPSNWTIKNFDEICSNIYSGGTPNTREATYWNDGVPWLSSGETKENYVIDTDKKISNLGVENSSTKLALKGSTVIASAGQGHTRGQASMLLIDSYVNQSVVVLNAETSKLSNYFLFFDCSRRYSEFRRVSDSSSSRGSLTTKILASLQVILPPIEIINHFDFFISPMIERIGLAKQETSKIIIMRDILLPKLISGELRIPDAEKIVEEVGI